MALVKMKYGIDLGTTNSAICKMENGEPAIIKTDTLKDTMPSCVSFTKKKMVRVGDSAFNDLRQDKSRATKHWTNDKENVFIEFKRTMGLDTQYESSFMKRSFSSEELSAEVLKALKSFVPEDNINAAVITIPAKFKADQIAATKRAACLAGIEHCELLQEPIAASMAYGLSASKKNGTWLVFDFGGGTFDVALIVVQDGVMQVKDTEGDNYLGGKNLDYAIIDEILIPRLQEEFTLDDILSDDFNKKLFRDAIKFYAEQIKNQLSFKDKVDITSQLDEFGEDDNGEEIELDMVVEREEFERVATPIFQKAIDITKGLLSRNHLAGKDIDSLILVGGPTHSPVLRRMLREQITENVDTSADPMTAVAKGAALFASGVDCSLSTPAEVGTLTLDVSYQSNSVESSEFVAIKLLSSESQDGEAGKFFVEITRGDKAWSSGKVEINEIGDVIECQLIPGKSNAFSITAFNEKGNSIPCFPNEFNIMQGIVVGHAVLPYNIGLEVHNDERNRDEFVPLKGLEKNKALPAVGVKNGLKTPRQLRPGMSDDRLIIPLYQGEHNAEGTSAIYNDHVFDVIVTGEDIPAVIPYNSDVDITIKVDSSQMMKAEISFPVIGEVVEKEVIVNQRSGVQEEELELRLNQAEKRLDNLREIPGVADDDTDKIDALLSDVTSRYENEKTSEDGKMHLLADLRRVFLRMEEIEKAHEQEADIEKLHQEYKRLEDANSDLGHKYDKEVEGLRRQVDNAIRQENSALIHKTLEDVKSLFFKVTFVYQLIWIIRDWSNNFTSCRWKDAPRARRLLDQGMEVIADSPTGEKLYPIFKNVFELLDDPDKNEKIKF